MKKLVFIFFLFHLNVTIAALNNVGAKYTLFNSDSLGDGSEVTISSLFDYNDKNSLGGNFSVLERFQNSEYKFSLHSNNQLNSKSGLNLELSFAKDVLVYSKQSLQATYYHQTFRPIGTNISLRHQRFLNASSYTLIFGTDIELKYNWLVVLRLYQGVVNFYQTDNTHNTFSFMIKPIKTFGDYFYVWPLYSKSEEASENLSPPASQIIELETIGLGIGTKRVHNWKFEVSSVKTTFEKTNRNYTLIEFMATYFL